MATTKTTFKKREKRGGRAKGTPNRRTVEVLKTVERVLGILDKTIDADIASLKPVDRAKMWNDLQEFVRPKLARTELTGKDGNAMEITVTKRVI